jgi:hypothetical protein
MNKTQIKVGEDNEVVTTSINIKVGNLYLESDDAYAESLYMIEKINGEMVKIRYIDNDEGLELHYQILVNMISSGEDRLVSEV